jgi:hypothetical protein
MISRRALMGTGALGVVIEDVFSTDLYTGNASTKTITNGINLNGEGGLTWIKSRSASLDHQLFDTERGATKELVSNRTSPEATNPATLTAFNSDGFSLGSDNGVNGNTQTFAAWTFRKAPKFFDVVTYTGTGSARTIPHGLDCTVGMIIVKSTNLGSFWAVYHRGNTAAPATDYLLLNNTVATADDTTYWNDTEPTDSVFTVGNNADVNSFTSTYVAYLFAHDTTGGNAIQCGSYTGNNSSDGPIVTLGWEPQWLLIKRATGSVSDWTIYDNKRSPTNFRDDTLAANISSNEGTNVSSARVNFDSTGFQLKAGSPEINGSGGTYIYMAIRAEE